MAYELLNLYNQDPEEHTERNLRLAMMFQAEVEEATRAYMEILHITIDQGSQTQEDITQAVKTAITAALLTGIRAYRDYLTAQGVDVEAIEAQSGKDIPTELFRPATQWPL